MDVALTLLVIACCVLTRFKNNLAMVAALEFVATSSWYLSPIPDPWWFFVYSIINCVFFVVVVFSSQSNSGRKFAWTLIFSAGLALVVFCEFYTGSGLIHGWRPFIMAVVCTYQLWLVTVDAGLMENVTDGFDSGGDLCGSGLGRYHQTDNLVEET